MENKITTMERGMQRRTELLLGKDNLEKIQAARVLIFGVGGVGSWCVEGLLRSGIRNITMVDCDHVCVTNCNRQLMEEYDFIIDAIDSLKDKADLILRATALPKEITFISSMGAALRRDPFMVRKAEFWKVDGDPLARALRKKFKKNKTFPRRKFQCVYSEEKPMQNQGENCEYSSTKAQINGSLCHITATFGMAIAGMEKYDYSRWIDRRIRRHHPIQGHFLPD